MQLVARRLLTTIFSGGIFVLVASSASSPSAPAGATLAPASVTAVSQRPKVGTAVSSVGTLHRIHNHDPSIAAH